MVRFIFRPVNPIQLSFNSVYSSVISNFIYIYIYIYICYVLQNPTTWQQTKQLQTNMHIWNNPIYLTNFSTLHKSALTASFAVVIRVI